MQETRRARLQSVIRQEISSIVQREIKDPRIPPVTFTTVEVTQDAAEATVWVTILGGADRAPDGSELSEAQAKERMKKCIEGLTSAAGYLRRHLGSVLDIKHTPKLMFKADRGLENSSKVFHLLKEIEKQKAES
jgi:ribosome-binding factor A